MNDWVTYQAKENNKPFSIKIDITFQDEQRRRAFPNLFIARLRGFEADPVNGFPTKHIFDRCLYPFEDRFEAIVRKAGGAFVLTSVDANVAVYLAYLPAGAQIDESVQRVARNVRLSLDVESRPSPAWSEYLQMLPSPRLIERSRDLVLIGKFQSAGDDVEKPRTVDFNLDFTDIASAQQAANELRNDNLVAEVNDPYPSVTVHIVSGISPRSISEIRQRLSAIVEKHGGLIDGWATTLERPPRRWAWPWKRR